MSNHRLRWALLCVAATQGALLAIRAEASETVAVRRGDSIDSIARRYHLSWKDIARANGISHDTVLIDGRKLLIPDPPRSVKSKPTMRLQAAISGDRIAVRQGPYTAYRRVALLDHNAHVTVTRKAGDWFQVELPNGRAGWVLSSFVTTHRGRSSVQAVEASRSAHVERRRSAHVDSEEHAKRSKHRQARAKPHKARQVARSEGSSHRKRSASSDRSHRKRVVSEERTRRKRVKVAAVSRHWRRESMRRGRSHRPEADAPTADTDVVRTAYAYRGVPYHYGGSSRRGFDCSGFTSYVYNRKGVDLPHNAAEQFGRGKRVTSDAMKKGDLVFFHTTRRGISHVGIYVGDGKFVHASSGGGRVRVDSLRSGYYKERFKGARRVR